MDDADALENVVAAVHQEDHVVVGFFNSCLLAVYRHRKPGAFGHVHIFVGLNGGDQESVANDAGPKIFEAVLAGPGDLFGAFDGACGRGGHGHQELEKLAVGDHVEGARTEDGHQHQDAQVKRFAQEDVAGRGGNLLHLSLVMAAGGGRDVYGCVEGLDGTETVVHLLDELLEGRVHQARGDHGLVDEMGPYATREGKQDQQRESEEEGTEPGSRRYAVARGRDGWGGRIHRVRCSLQDDLIDNKTTGSAACFRSVETVAG